MFSSTFLIQMFCQLIFSLKNFIKIVWLVSAALSINGLSCVMKVSSMFGCSLEITSHVAAVFDYSQYSSYNN